MKYKYMYTWLYAQIECECHEMLDDNSNLSIASMGDQTSAPVEMTEYVNVRVRIV